ncbi:hypothetical protein D3C76_1217350 [compost metagenome]
MRLTEVSIRMKRQYRGVQLPFCRSTLSSISMIFGREGLASLRSCSRFCSNALALSNRLSTSVVKVLRRLARMASSSDVASV